MSKWTLKNRAIVLLTIVIFQKNKQKDLYILVTGEFPEYDVKAFVEKERVFLDKNIKQIWGKDKYIVEQDEMTSMEFWGILC